MSSELKIYENVQFGQLRIVEIDGEPWFVGKDVAEALGYQNTRDAILRHVDSEDKGVVKHDTLGGGQEVTIINESGLYSLILSSKLESAKQFKRWVTSEVIPAIRKHGGYLTNEKIEEAILNPDVLIRLATDLKNERAKTAALEAQREADKPKVLFADSVSASDTDINIGQNRLFKLLRKEGYLCSRGAQKNVPTQYAMDLGLFRLKETTINRPDGKPMIVRVNGVGSEWHLGSAFRIFLKMRTRRQGEMTNFVQVLANFLSRGHFWFDKLIGEVTQGLFSIMNLGGFMSSISDFAKRKWNFSTEKGVGFEDLPPQKDVLDALETERDFHAWLCLTMKCCSLNNGTYCSVRAKLLQVDWRYIDQSILRQTPLHRVGKSRTTCSRWRLLHAE